MAMSNFLVRTLSSVAIVAVTVAGTLLNPQVCGLLFLILMYIAAREFLSMSMGGRWPVQQKLALLAAAAIYMLVSAVAFYGVSAAWLMLAFPFLAAIPVSVLFVKHRDDLEDIALLYTAFVYITLPLSLVPLFVMCGGEFDGMRLFAVFVLIWAADVGAYCLGTLFGQKPGSLKLAPTISPKKSWWGFWGGLGLAVVAGVALCLSGLMPFPAVHGAGLGFVVAVSAVCGDLFESVWKRRYGVKDSGRCIPGHGGMLDRIDSALFAIPAAFAYLALFDLI